MIRGAALEYDHHYHGNPLQAAASSGNSELVKRLLDQPKWLRAINSASKTFGTALFAAADGDCTEVVELLISHGANVNYEHNGYNAMTAFTKAFFSDRKDNMLLLLNAGADADLQQTLNDYFVKLNPEIIKTLIDWANKHGVGLVYERALNTAARAINGKEDIVRLLLANGADVNGHIDLEGRGALHQAAKQGTEEAALLLVRAGATIDDSILSMAASRGFGQLIECLLCTYQVAETGYSAAVRSAAEHGHETLVRRLVEAACLAGAAVDLNDALEAALAGMCENAIIYLVGRGAKLQPEIFNEKSNVDISRLWKDEFSSAFRRLLDGCRYRAALLLLAQTVADLDKKTRFDILIHTAQAGSVPMVVSQLHHLPSDVKCRQMNLAFQAAASKGQSKILELLRDQGANVNARCEGEFEFAIHAASSYGDPTVVRQLIRYGADVNAKGEDATALQIACREGHLQAVEVLLSAKADVNMPSALTGNSPLRDAVKNGHARIARLLLEEDTRTYRSLEANILQATAKNGRVPMIELLLSYGADINEQSRKYGNALQAAVVGKNIETIRYLLNNGADMHAEGGIYGCALHAAVSLARHSTNIVKLLLAHGADVSLKVMGVDAFEVAEKAGDDEILSMLRGSLLGSGFDSQH